MAVDDRMQVTQAAHDRPTTADIIDRLTRFEGPPEQFLINLLAVQCHISGAAAGAIFRPSPQNGQPEVLAVFPPLPEGATAPVWLAQAVEASPRLLQSGRTLIQPLRSPGDLYGQPSSQQLLAIPLKSAAGVRGVAAFVLDSYDPAAVAASRERLELTVSLLSLYEMRLTLQRRQFDLRRLRLAMETLSAINDQDRFAGAAMAMVNEIASRWQADRVSLGLLKGRYVKLKALSHTEKFSRKMKLVQDIEAAQEECLDQDLEVVHPAPDGATFVARATGELCKRHGPTAIVSLPLRKNGQPIAVLTVERPVDQPYALDEIEALRLTCDLCSPRVAVLHEHDRWFGAKLADGVRKTLALAVGPKHTWVKAAAVLAVAAVLFITLVKGDYQAEAPFAFDTVERQVVTAPFDGYLVPTDVEPGNAVESGTVLASLETWEKQEQLAAAQAKLVEYQANGKLAEAAGKPAEQQIALAQAESMRAQIRLLEGQIARAEIRSPIAGRLLAGDWKRARRKHVQSGEPLFEVAPLSALWAELNMPEDQIADVRVGQRGELAAISHPDQRVGFEVEWISPVAEVVDNQNAFKVRVRLDERADWMHPGMEGVAKVHLGEKTYAWLWSRRLVNWVRMKLWW